jgi:hypothetical protein
MSLEIKLGNKPIRSGRPANIFQRKFLWVFLASLPVMAFILAPGIIMFVINHEQKQCAMMWVGDEYAQYGLPKLWQKAEPDSKGMLQGQFGSCNYNEVKNGTISNEDCCKKLGYTFIGEIKGVETNRDYGLTIGLYLLILPVLIFKNWFPIAIFLVVIYFLRKWFKNKANKQEITGEQNDSSNKTWQENDR